MRAVFQTIEDGISVHLSKLSRSREFSVKAMKPTLTSLRVRCGFNRPEGLVGNIFSELFSQDSEAVEESLVV